MNRTIWVEFEMIEDWNDWRLKDFYRNSSPNNNPAAPITSGFRNHLPFLSNSVCRRLLFWFNNIISPSFSVLWNRRELISVSRTTVRTTRLSMAAFWVFMSVDSCLYLGRCTTTALSICMVSPRAARRYWASEVWTITNNPIKAISFCNEFFILWVVFDYVLKEWIALYFFFYSGFNRYGQLYIYLVYLAS